MRQKVVIKVVSMSDHKTRKKALKTVVSCFGVDSIALQGESKDKIEVIGEGMDAVTITKSLRKNVGHAEIVNLGPVD
ncbi:OLC1v1023494C1 [Oldenlandia corymbosa var. corymbosa]|uniref:OLC1v1023494C1 n=1 Tax=Oldenlandia corymbosa var. corymbosa TaxID=529605 RepID=A0AAV1C049_OLDCO|nr:OLC1v1023494C1 [Oldenlandia corymbosa var. corymbosa]